MKKFFASVLSIGLAACLVACGAGSTSDGSQYKIDLESTEEQAMSDQRASAETLSETFYTYLKGTTYFMDGDENSELNYGDIAKHIGCDATLFQNTENYGRAYTWKAEGNDKQMLTIYFKADGNGDINLYAAGSFNLEKPTPATTE